MGILSKILKTTGFGLSVKELSDYKKKMEAEGKDPFSPAVFIKEYGKPLYNKIVGEYKDAFGKNMGGMMEARKKGMKGKKADAYVYGTMRKTGWRPAREERRACR